MAQYSLTITLTRDELQAFDSQHLQIVLLHTPTQGQQPAVAWAVFQPFLNNVVTWQPAYGVFAAAGQAKPGSIITALDSTARTAEGQAYDFTPDGYFEPSQSAPQPGAYRINNACTKASFFTFGLTQDVTVNGELRAGAFLNTTTGYPNTSLIMTPADKYALLLASNVQAGQVFTPGTQPITPLTFSPSNASQRLGYDDQTGLFVPTA